MPLYKHIMIATALSFSAGHALADAPDPNEVQILDLNYRGPGCPDGSVAQNLSADRKAVTLLFDDFIVATDDAPNQTKVRKHCKVDLEMQVPKGWSYGLFCVDYRGYAALDIGQLLVFG